MYLRMKYRNCSGQPGKFNMGRYCESCFAADTSNDSVSAPWRGRTLMSIVCVVLVRIGIQWPCQIDHSHLSRFKGSAPGLNQLATLHVTMASRQRGQIWKWNWTHTPSHCVAARWPGRPESSELAKFLNVRKMMTYVQTASFYTWLYKITWRRMGIIVRWESVF